MTRTALAHLTSLGVLRIDGPEARRFLQGQLSNDLERLGPGSSLLAGLHNPQGRVVALLRLLAGPGDTVLAVLPRELVPLVATRLGRFVLRAKVRIDDATAQCAVYGVAQGTQRDLLVLATAQTPPLGERLDEAQWHAADIAAGLPQVYASTSEKFIAQMLNLDLIDAISFTKGCYTGQEIIARAHYRGRVKRRMQRFVTHAPLPQPGEQFRLADGRMLEVVDAAPLAAGGYDLLAVAPLTAVTPADAAADAAAALPQRFAEQAVLPYRLAD